ncbi:MULTISPECIES: hypothetical protein [unclassified Microcoleus]|uniref:hypothetical protein n=1 Tax=unclassified Microcoleus TaxID=2642155 RepID=UPI002FD02B9C
MSKTAKKRSLLIDALRILAWEEYKATNKEELKNLEYGGYAIFDAEWKVEDIHDKTYEELLAFAKSLEFSEAELLGIRSKYYANKTTAAAGKSNRTLNGNSNGNGNVNGNVSSQQEEYDVEDAF